MHLYPRKISYTILYALVAAIAVLGILTIFNFIHVNHVRGDESLSFLHSDPDRFTLGDVLRNLKSGADQSYTHALMLWLAFKLFGYTLGVMRVCSLLFWFVGGVVLFRLLNKMGMNVLHVSLSLILILFSNLGVFLAADGRFYSLVFVMSVWQFNFLYNREQLTTINVFVLASIQLLSLLTSPLLLIWNVLLALAYVFTHTHKTKLTRLAVFISTIVVYLVYILFFKVSFLFDFFAETYTPHQFGIRLHSEISEWPFRSILLVDMPFVSDAYDGVLLMIVLGYIAYLWFTQRTLKMKYDFFTGVSRIVLIFLLLLIFGNTCLNLPVWPMRYFAFVFYLLPIFVVRALCVFELKPLYSWFVVLGLTLLLNRSVSVWQKIDERRAVVIELEKQLHSSWEFIETNENKYKPFVQAGELYVRFPEYRDSITYRYEANEPKRAAYFRILHSLGYAVIR